MEIDSAGQRIADAVEFPESVYRIAFIGAVPRELVASGLIPAYVHLTVHADEMKLAPVAGDVDVAGLNEINVGLVPLFHFDDFVFAVDGQCLLASQGFCESG